MPKNKPRATIPLHRLLRRLPARDRLRVILRLLGSRREVVVLGGAVEESTRPAPREVTPGRVLFRPELTELWPLWAVGDDGATAAREDIPLPEDFKRRLDDWARRWNQVMYDNFYEWPEDGRERASFDREARRLCDALAGALGPGWEVEYGGVDA